jgi:hypothetical protein
VQQSASADGVRKTSSRRISRRPDRSSTAGPASLFSWARPYARGIERLEFRQEGWLQPVWPPLPGIHQRSKACWWFSNPVAGGLHAKFALLDDSSNRIVTICQPPGGTRGSGSSLPGVPGFGGYGSNVGNAASFTVRPVLRHQGLGQDQHHNTRVRTLDRGCTMYSTCLVRVS